MRTRRQDNTVEPEPVSAAPSPSEGLSPKHAPASPMIVSITQVEGSKAVTRPSHPQNRGSRLPPIIQFPLIVTLSLALSSLGFSLAHPWTKGVLATYARSLESWEEYGVLIGWRVFELALGWFGNYDGYDLSALNVLSHGPALYLLAAFYNTPPSALLLSLAIETFSTYLPFRLLRPLSIAHGDPASAPNADLLTDKPITLLTNLLSGAIYTVTLLAAYATYLPSALVIYFDGIPSIQAAHEGNYIHLLPVTLTLGFAATTFVFPPSEAEESQAPAAFDPVSATLRETLYWNFWGWSQRAKTVIKRTAVLILVTGAGTAVQTALTIQGAGIAGAVAWASVWMVAAGVTGLALGAVGSV
ncbi:hypothetical protein BX600DRAFT_508869 [Xylariales sp. PMI_506]|nr:hypothetical protein BX600DRAFT_508869 [Xylariales sp. PMI_506]